MKKKATKKVKRKVGRPTVMSKDTLRKLEEIFAIGGSDEEACFYANISHQSLYDYQKKYPEFIERKNSLKQRPILKARQAVVSSLNDPVIAMKYLEKKKKDEFGNDINLNIGTQKDLDRKEEKINKLLEYAKTETTRTNTSKETDT